MGKKERYITFVTGTIIFFLVYTLIQYLFREQEIDLFTNLIISVLWSGGMLAFEVWRKKKKQLAQ